MCSFAQTKSKSSTVRKISANFQQFITDSIGSGRSSGINQS